jgi:hypothetical protein
MYARQRGVTFIGWLFLLVPIAMVGYTGIRVIPIYLNYMRVARALDQTATEAKSDDVNLKQLRTSISRRFEIDSVEYPDINDVSIRREGQTWTLEAKFEDSAPLFGNLSILVSFDKVARTG